TGDKTFYAKWTADTYNISYQNVNGASNSNPATYTIADTPLTLADLTGGPTGYTFDGWYDDATFSGTPITAIPAGSTGNKTFYAKWTAVQDSFKTETNELNSVPPELLNTPFNTVEKIENELLLKLGVDRTTVNGRWISYDVKLKVSTDGGKTWVDADPGNFPAEGLPVILPYPSGTGQYTHRFQVSHMFTTTVNGYQPGQVETPEATNTKSGIRVTLKGLSPVVIMWERVESSGGGTSASTGAAVSPAPVAQIKQNFDSKYYADTYADLKAAFGYDHDALWNHYVMFGKNEKRKVRFVVGINLFPGMIFNYSDRWQMDDVMLRARIPDSAYFDTDAYADLYPDLKAAFGYNHELLYRHYLKYGRFEGRKVFTRNSFNAKAYADRYADLKKAFGYDKAALWRHYQMFGKVERRFAEWMEDEGQKD
ncbi:MAG: InlB B-repeat-containing protein, partial [Lachnospiraceae bacterium]|nr:InlB B-repeat-containing protein [Lachnospiraceae bacterium]